MNEQKKIIMRPGKTSKDHASGSWNNRFSNRATRVAWQKAVQGQGGKGAIALFPLHTCNGKSARALRNQRGVKR